MNLGNFGRRKRGFGRGRRNNSRPGGPGGICICVNPNCRNEIPHQAGVPCYQMSCPKCGSPVVRKNSE